MKVVKRTAEYTVYQKRSERYAVKGADKAYINGDEKAKILLAEGLIKVVLPEPKPEEPEAPAEEAVEEAAEEAVEKAGDEATAEADAPEAEPEAPEAAAEDKPEGE